jgi:hypothetical protein
MVHVGAIVRFSDSRHLLRYRNVAHKAAILMRMQHYTLSLAKCELIVICQWQGAFHSVKLSSIIQGPVRMSTSNNKVAGNLK